MRFILFLSKKKESVLNLLWKRRRCCWGLEDVVVGEEVVEKVVELEVNSSKVVEVEVKSSNIVGGSRG